MLRSLGVHNTIRRDRLVRLPATASYCNSFNSAFEGENNAQVRCSCFYLRSIFFSTGNSPASEISTHLQPDISSNTSAHVNAHLSSRRTLALPINQPNKRAMESLLLKKRVALGMECQYPDYASCYRDCIAGGSPANECDDCTDGSWACVK